jgi:outer membrane lipoprotein-sorting protein
MTRRPAYKVAPLPEGGEVEMKALEYFEAGGMPRALVLKSRMNSAVLTMVVDDVKFNQPIPDSIFALPADIERLMKMRFAAK